MAGIDMPIKAMRSQISSAVTDQKPRVYKMVRCADAGLITITGMEGDVIVQEIFR
jgi:hypothetical protein